MHYGLQPDIELSYLLLSYLIVICYVCLLLSSSLQFTYVFNGML